MKSVIITCLALASMLLVNSTLANVINIPNDYPTIQQGINVAINGDTVLVADGVYTENIDFIGKSIEVMSQNGPIFTSIQIANSGIPVVSLTNGETRNSTLKGFTITGDLSDWGIFIVSSSPTIYGNNITLHEAGIRVNNGGPLIRKNDISLCEHLDIDPLKGAGIYIDYSSNAYIDSNNIHNNIANVDPALVISFCSDIEFRNNVIYSNSAHDYLSGIGMDNSDNVDLINNTVVGNNVTTNNYLGSFHVNTSINVNVVNNIVAFNGDMGFFNYSNSNITYNYNDSYGNSQGNYSGYTPGSGSISLDPLFVDPGNNDYHLLVGSPCIDSGDPNSPLDPDSTIADMGALHGAYTPPPGEIIRVPADYQTIQAAIDASSNSDTILVSDGIYNEHINFNGKRILVISENGYEGAIINGVSSDIPVVLFESNENHLSILKGFTVRNSFNAPGIGIYNASPLILDNLITENGGNPNYSGEGGGIYCFNFSGIIRGNILSGNLAGSGGGVSIWNSNGAICDSNKVFNNSCTYWAAGIRLRLSDNCIVSHNVIYGNYAGTGTGAINLSEANNSQIINNTMDSNSSPGYGAIAIWYSYDANLVNNIVTNTIGTSGIFMGGTSSGTVTFCNSFGNSGGDYEGISPGPGCISVDPLFIGGDPFDYHLRAGSPCIDAGDPESPLDPDGSIADMGALYSGEIITNYGFDIADVYGENNQPVDVPVMAFGLEDQDIAGAEFHISFDNTCLQYDTTISDYFADMLINIVGDEIHILWEDFANPVVLPESSAAFELQFTALGQLGDTCAIDWLSNNEIVDSTGNVVDGIEFTGGEVRVIEFHSISGRVIYYDMVTPLENIDMELSGDWTGSEITDQNGFYQFEYLFPGDFSICPERDVDDPGVTVSDVVKIRRHLVLLEPFDSPYKFVAADVNESDYVSVADIIKIRRYLAGLEPLPSGNWSFVDSSFAITDENWMNAPECIDFNIWGDDLTDSSFVGVRMGDVDVTLGMNGGPPIATDNVLLDLIDVQGAPGDTVVMPLQVQGFVDVAGIELHLEFPEENLDFVGFNTNIIWNYTLNVVDGEIHLIWEDIDNSLTLPSNTELLNISFEILPGTTENMPVSFMSAFVVNVVGTDFSVYTSDGVIILRPVSIDDDSPLPAEFNLHQNYPNPFNARTRIKYDVPNSCHVRIEVFDLLGRKIETMIDTEIEAGFHDLIWNADTLPSGIYFYVMRAGDYVRTNKMMLLK